MKLKTILPMTVAAIAFASCSNIVSSFSTVECNPDSPMSSDQRKITASINALSASRGVRVYYQQSDSLQLTVNAPEDLIDLIVTEIDENELSISAKKNLGNCSERVSVTVKAPGVCDFDVNSGAMLQVSDGYRFYAGEVEVDVSSGAAFNALSMVMDSIDVEASSGAAVSISSIKAAAVSGRVSSGAAMTLAGEATTVDFGASSGGALNASSLKAVNGSVKASSGGNLQSNIENIVSRSASSGGSITNR